MRVTEEIGSRVTDGDVLSNLDEVGFTFFHALVVEVAVLVQSLLTEQIEVATQPLKHIPVSEVECRDGFPPARSDETGIGSGSSGPAKRFEYTIRSKSASGRKKEETTKPGPIRRQGSSSVGLLENLARTTMLITVVANEI